MKFKSITGTRDILPNEQPYWRFIEKTIRDITDLYGFHRVETPILEETGLFVRSVGETTDIVEKEMYTFLDKGKKSVTMRPEFTAGILRLYIQNGLHMWPKPVKVFSIGPIFRYERPQAGRFRQHTQFNVEALGEQEPAMDLEVMSIAHQLYTELGFQDLSFQLNSTGCPACRPDYIKRLVQYYRERVDEICGDCLRRLDKNPLRVLDCKVDRCQPVIKNAPVITLHLCRECDEHFTRLKDHLNSMDYSYVINHTLVRGLDYYTKTVFEVWAKGIGAQNAMCGGGRYDGLVELLGGVPTPGIGFGSGIERIILSMQEQDIRPDPLASPGIFIAFSGEAAHQQAIKLTFSLRRKKTAALLAFGQRSLKSQLREANRQGAVIVVILGDMEIESQNATVKNLQTGKQFNVPMGEIVDFLTEKSNL